MLTLAYMNKESLEISLREKKTCFGPDPEGAFGVKGKTSGNYQHIVSITADCDRDALVVMVNKDGPACHLGTDSCFNYPVMGELPLDFSVKSLYKMLEGRKAEMPEGSYTTYLFEKGMDKILKKIGEESTEVIIAAKAGDKEETVYEIADLMYHVMVLMVEMGISVDDVMGELESRHIIDHKVKQEKNDEMILLNPKGDVNLHTHTYYCDGKDSPRLWCSVPSPWAFVRWDFPGTSIPLIRTSA